MSKSQTAISEQTRKTCGSDLVWTGADFPLILTQTTERHCYLVANLSYFSGLLYLLWSGHPVERSWRCVTDVGSHRRGGGGPLGNCACDMQGLFDLMPHPCLHGSVVTLQFAPYLDSLSSDSGSREDQPSSQKPGCSGYRWNGFTDGACVTVCLSELLLWHVYHHVSPHRWPLCWSHQGGYLFYY